MADGGEGLYDRPVLVLDTGTHTAMYMVSAVDPGARVAVTGSRDKTVRIWSPEDGRLLRNIRLPRGPEDVGKVYAVAVSPDATLAAVAGWMRWTEADPHEQIYLFDVLRGAMVGRIEGLPGAVGSLAFSPDGTQLAAGISGGLRVFGRDTGWQEVARDDDYGGASCDGVAFAPDGRLATAAHDGLIRLYAADGTRTETAEAGALRPYVLSFDRHGARLAVGFVDEMAVRVLDGGNLKPVVDPDLTGIDGGNLAYVAWSPDGGTLYAGGEHGDLAGNSPVLAWDAAGAGARRRLAAGRNTVMGLHALPDGDILVAAADPWLGRLAADGTPRWTAPPQQMDPWGQPGALWVSDDGLVVDFACGRGTPDRARFDLTARRLTPDPPADGLTAPPDQHSLPVTGWVNEPTPALGETPLQLWGGENARCLAIDAAGGRVVLGADWSLHAFDAEGKPLWLRGVPDSAYAVNITADRRLVVAAYGDGTVRWHRLEDGAELLALFPMVDRENWVAWTPEGIYAASQKALRVLRWHRNRGWDAAGKDYPVADIPESHRPEVISLVVPQLDEIRALGVANMMQFRNAVQRVTGADVKTGARLHVLAIGVSDYGDAARHLDLQFAHFDARDVATALKHSQSNLYAEVLPIQLLDGDATKDGIIAGLNAVRRAMEAGNGHDLAVVLFSGHGEVVDDSFFLMPHGVDDSTPDKIEATALPIGQFHDKIAAIAERGRVIVLLDACRSGKATGLTQRSLRALLTAANVTVFTSSSDKQLSVERTDWQNGAFCEALLEALSKADFNRDTRIGMNDLALYLGDRVPALTGGTQCPDVEFRGTDIQVFEVGV